MKKIFMLLLMILNPLLITSCVKEVDSKEYISWVKDFENGLHVIKESNGIIFDLQYQPNDYVFLMSKENGDGQMLEHDKQIHHFVLNINLSNHDASDNSPQAETYQEMIYYFSYLFQNDLKLEESEVILPCIMFHFEKAQSKADRMTFILGFESRVADAKQLKLMLNSKYFGSLPINMEIVKKNIPSLKI